MLNKCLDRQDFVNLLIVFFWLLQAAGRRAVRKASPQCQKVEIDGGGFMQRWLEAGNSFLACQICLTQNTNF